MRIMRRPSAMMITGSSGAEHTRDSDAASSFSLNSPAVCVTKVQQSRGAGTISRLPVEALDASTRSSMRRLSLSDCLTTTSEYSAILGSAGSAAPINEA